MTRESVQRWLLGLSAAGLALAVLCLMAQAIVALAVTPGGMLGLASVTVFGLTAWWMHYTP